MKIYKHENVLFSFGFVLTLAALFFSTFSMAFAVPVATTVVLPASEDAWIDQANPLSFFGTSTDIQVQSSGNANERGLVAYNLSSIPANANITSAVMSLFLFIAPQSDRVYSLNDIDDATTWSEDFINWNNQPSINPTVVSSAPIVSTSVKSFITWDVTSEVSKMVSGAVPNQGWEIRDAQENSMTSESKTSIFRAHEYGSVDATEVPSLTVTYTLPATTASISGTVFNDTNGDGLLSSGESGIAGWTITLSGDATSTTLTDASGNYSFGALSDGTYNVCETPASSTPAWLETAPVAGFDCGGGLFGYNVTISSSTSATAQDFGNVLSSTTPPVATTTPSVPTLLSPADASITSPDGLLLDWSDVTVSASSSPVSYFYQVATSSATTTQNSLFAPVATSSALSVSQASVSGLSDGTYFWQARACDVNLNCSDWSDPFQLILLTPTTTPVTPPVSGGGGGGGGGGGNGPIYGSYGVILTSASNIGGGGVTSTSIPVDETTAGNSANNNGESVLVPPATSGQIAPSTFQSNPPQNPVVAQNYPSSNSGTSAENEGSGSQTQTSTTSVAQSSPQQPQQAQNNNANETAAAASSGASSSSAFWIWAIIILVIIGLIFYIFRTVF